MFGKRADATLVPDVHPYRRIMPYIMRTRNESAVYFDTQIDISKTQRFIERYNAAHPEHKITVFHVCAWAMVKLLDAKPELNRFVAGGKLYQRDGVWLSYAAKESFDEKAKLVTLTREFDAGAGFEELVEAMTADKKLSRSGEETHTDKELSLFLRLPGPILRVGVRAIKALDNLGLLPRSYTKPDPMYASVFLANLGSIGLAPAYHHLYEYGNCPIFMVIGKTRDAAVVENGEVVVKPVVDIRFSYDERIHDGFYAGRGLVEGVEYVRDPVAHGATAKGTASPSHAPPATPATARRVLTSID